MLDSTVDANGLHVLVSRLCMPEGAPPVQPCTEENNSYSRKSRLLASTTPLDTCTHHCLRIINLQFCILARMKTAVNCHCMDIILNLRPSELIEQNSLPVSAWYELYPSSNVSHDRRICTSRKGTLYPSKMNGQSHGH